MNEDKKLIYDISDKPSKKEIILYSIQHCLAMFVATALISILIYGNFNMVPAAIISAGIGTIVYGLITRFKSPVFLGSSAALMPIMSTCLLLGWEDNKPGSNYIALIIGLTIVCIIYTVLGILVKKFGTKWLYKLLPSVVVGPVVALIGLGLAGFATSWSMYNGGNTFNGWSLFIAIVTMLTVVLISHYGKGKLKTLPFLIAIAVGFVLSLVITWIGQVTGINSMILVTFPEIDWFPNFAITEALKGFEANHFNWDQIPTILLVAVPVSFVAFCEHIGDHLNLSNVINKDLLNEPGLNRTSLGDGIATAIGGIIGGMGNTTYGENVSVIGVTKVASVYPIIGAAILSIILGLCAPIMWIIRAIPYCVFGGCAMVLYGFIAISGLRELKKVDLNNTKNTLVASVILICGVGGLYLPFGSFTFSGIALAMVIGIVLNLILKNERN